LKPKKTSKSVEAVGRMPLQRLLNPIGPRKLETSSKSPFNKLSIAIVNLANKDVLEASQVPL